MRDTAPTPRRNRVVEVTEAPVVREAEPLPWANYRWAQPTKCEILIDVDDPSKSRCGVEYTPVGNQRTCGSERCVRNMLLVADRRRSKTYREGHREEIRARNCSPKAYARHKELRDQRKASQPPIWNTCRWWTAVAEGAPIRKYRACPAPEGQFQAKRKNDGFCSDECETAFLRNQNRIWLNNDRKADPEKYERGDYHLNWSRNDRKVNPEKYRLKIHNQWLQRKAGREPEIIKGECGHSFEHFAAGAKPKRCPDCGKPKKKEPRPPSLEKTKPWLAEGISRTSWFRRRREAAKG